MNNWFKKKAIHLFIWILFFLPHLFSYTLLRNCVNLSFTYFLLIQKVSGTRNGPSATATWSCKISQRSWERSWAGYKILPKQTPSLQNFWGKNIVLVVCRLQCELVAFQKSEVSSTSKVRMIPIKNCFFQVAVARWQQLLQLDSLKLIGVPIHRSIA